MKLTLLLLVVTGCLAKPHLSQRERNFWEKLNRLQDYKPDESKRDFYDDDESKRDFYDDDESKRDFYDVDESKRDFYDDDESKRDFYDDDESKRDFYDDDESKRDFYDDDESKRSAITAPATTKKTPATTKKTPATTKKTPATTKKTPATTKKTPATTKKTPATTKKTPATTKKTPATTKKTPATTKKTPATIGPATTKKTPATIVPPTTKKTPATIVSPTTKKTPATIVPPTTKKTPATIVPPTTKKTPPTTKKTPASEIEELEVAFNKSRWKSRNEAIWVFTDNWSEAVFGDLVAGYSVLIVYDGARLPWRDTKYGQRAWNIYAQFKFDDGKVHQQLLQGPIMIEGHEILTTKIFLPFGTSKLTIWFKYSGESGIHWDSDYGNNYEEQVHEVKEPTLVFNADYTDDQYGRSLKQGGKFQVYYSTARLDVSDGFRLYAVAQFKASGGIITHELTNPHDGYYVTSFHVSEDAEEVIMWFYTKKGYERHYDSNFGANYHFPLGY